MKLLEQRNIFTSTWFSSAENSFIAKFLVKFCDQIHRYHNDFWYKIQNKKGLELAKEKTLKFDCKCCLSTICPPRHRHNVCIANWCIWNHLRPIYMCVSKCTGCHKAITVIIGRAFFIKIIHMHYV